MRLVVKKKKEKSGKWKGAYKYHSIELYLCFTCLSLEKNQVSGCKQGEARYRT